MQINEKAKGYCALLALLEHENLTSISLVYDFMKNISDGCGISMEEVSELMLYARENVDFEVSGIYWQWKKQAKQGE